MKDSQQAATQALKADKYIKANNERFSTGFWLALRPSISISRRIMKDSQPMRRLCNSSTKYIKANNERFSTALWMRKCAA